MGKEKTIMNRPKYQQPHSIRDFDPEWNIALREHLINKEHRRQKYETYHTRKEQEYRSARHR